MRSANFLFFPLSAFIFSCASFSAGLPTSTPIDVLEKEAKNNLDQNNYLKTIIYCDTILMLDSTNVNGLFRKGVALTGLNKNEEAIALFNKIISKTNSYSEPFGWRGFVRENMGDTIGAMSDYNKSIELNPKYFKSRNNRGDLFLKMGKFEDANNDFEVAFEIDSNSTALLNNMATLQSKMQNYPKAIYFYDRALQIEKKDFLFFGRGNTKYRMNMFGDAILDYSEAIALNSQNSSYYLYQGLAYQKIGRAELMANDWKQAAMLGNQQAVQYLNTYCK